MDPRHAGSWLRFALVVVCAAAVLVAVLRHAPAPLPRSAPRVEPAEPVAEIAEPPVVTTRAAVPPSAAGGVVAVESTTAAAASRGASLRLSLTRTDGRAVTGGTVQLASGTQDQWFGVGSGDLDGAGRCVIEFADPVDWIGWSPVGEDDRWHGFAAGTRTFAPPLAPADGPRELVIQVEDGDLTVTGTVLDARTGGAVDAARVALPGIGAAFRPPYVAAGADGRFVLAGVTFEDAAGEGTLRVRATHPRYLAGEVTVDAATVASRAELRISLEPGLVVRGTVVDPQGNPRGHGELTLTVAAGAFGEPAPKYLDLARTRCDDAGRFVFAAVRQGAFIEVVRDQANLGCRIVEDVHGKTELDLVVVEDPGVPLTIRARRKDGTAVQPFESFVRAADGRILAGTYGTAAAAHWYRLPDRLVADVVAFAGDRAQGPPSGWRGEQRVVVLAGLPAVDVVLSPDVRPQPLDRMLDRRQVHLSGCDLRIATYHRVRVEQADGTPFAGMFGFELQGARARLQMEDGRATIVLPPGRHRGVLQIGEEPPQVIDLNGGAGEVREWTFTVGEPQR